MAGGVPIIAQQPVAMPAMVMGGGPPMQPPVMYAAPGMPGMAPGMPAMMTAGYPGMPGMVLQGNPGVHPEPACGIGRTGMEFAQEQLEMAYANNSFEPQDFKPADDSPSRMYMCHELDGNWTMRSRYSIDRMGKEWRWHMAPEGYFYAVRLPN
jgi:hypothetical protein